MWAAVWTSTILCCYIFTNGFRLVVQIAENIKHNETSLRGWKPRVISFLIRWRLENSEPVLNHSYCSFNSNACKERSLLLWFQAVSQYLA
jgi:hypothetical protein